MPPSYWDVKNWLGTNGYRHWCFISWAKTSEDMEELVLSFHSRLLQELGTRVSSSAVFLDIGALKPGADWERELADAACRSVLMVPFYTPPYFWPTHGFCGREWEAMRQLSEKRLGDPGGLCPVCIQGSEQIPPEARIVQYRDLAPERPRYLKAAETTAGLADFAANVAERAIEIAGRLMQRSARACCDGFVLPATPFSGPARPEFPIMGGI